MDLERSYHHLWKKREMFPVENRQVLPAIPPLKLQLQPVAVLTQADYNQPMRVPCENG